MNEFPACSSSVPVETILLLKYDRQLLIRFSHPKHSGHVLVVIRFTLIGSYVADCTHDILTRMK